MVLRTILSFDKHEYLQEEPIRGHVDIDIDQYQAPTDGRKDEYLCKFKAAGHFSFQQPNLRKSRWKGQGAPNSSWKSFLLEGASCEFAVISEDCPYLLKPGQAKRVRSIPFSFNMPRSDLPASFLSPHGRAKVEYTVWVTTMGKKAKHTTSATFRLLPTSKIGAFQTYQHNFNVDIENGGTTSALSSPARNIITVSCPSHLLQETLQNITITFPSDRFMLHEVVLTLNSKLLVQASKSTFAIEENNHDLPCTLTDDSTTSKILSMRVPAGVSESFKMSLKRLAVRKSEILRLVVSYGVRTESGLLQCTSSCDISVAVIGVASPEMPPVDDLRRNDSLFSRLEPAIEEEDSPALDAEDPTARRDVDGSSTDVPPGRDPGQNTIASSAGAHDKGIRSTVKVLKSILKKPRRWSVEVEKTKSDTEVRTDVPDEPSIDSAATGNETISSLSLESKPIEHQPTAVPVDGDTYAQAAEVINGSSLSSHKPPRSSLQIAAFDRKLFAIRGAELRNEYMRDTSVGGRESYE